MHRVPEIDKANFDKDHPRIAIHLNNLAALFQGPHRLINAVPLMGRGLVILAKSMGAEYLISRTILGNYTRLLQELGRTDREINANLKDLFRQG